MIKELLLVCTATLVLIGCNFSTKGKSIDAYTDPKRALLVLDVQKDFTSDSARMPVNKGQVVPMMQKINLLISDSQKNGDMVVYVRNIFHKPDVANLFRHFAAVEGSPGIEFDDRLAVVSEHVFAKSQPDAFSNKELEKFLVANSVNEVTVCGVFADQCVYWTSRGALNRGYKVNYVLDAVAANSSNDIGNAAKSIEECGAVLVRAEK